MKNMYPLTQSTMLTSELKLYKDRYKIKEEFCITIKKEMIKLFLI